MKVVLIFVLALGVTLILAYLLGWRNLGNNSPVVPQKLLAQQSVRPNVATTPSTDPLGAASCQTVLDALQQQQSIESQLDWLNGYIAARNTAQEIPAAALGRDNLRTGFLALCAEHPADTLAQAADKLLAKLQPPPTP